MSTPASARSRGPEVAKADANTDNRALRKARIAPYAMAAPGVFWLYLFFLVPMVTLLKIALSTKPDRLLPVFEFNWHWDNFATAFDQYTPQLLRAFVYAAVATTLCVLIAYPIAY